MNIKKITVLYNTITDLKKGLEHEITADEDNYVAALSVSNALRKIGYDVTLFDVNHKTWKLLNNLKTDLIFNLIEGFDNLPNSFNSMVAYIESLNIPFTGTGSFTTVITTDKARTKDLLFKNKIPTPNYQLFTSEDEPLKYNLRYPLIVKPNSQDASVGITQESVVKNYNELKERVVFIREVYKDSAIAEEFLDGREMEVMTLKMGENIIVFPPLEIVFRSDNGQKWNIRDFDCKWHANKYYDEECPARIGEGVMNQIKAVVENIFKAFNVRGYMRLDMRLSLDEIPHVLEINNNPYLSLYEDDENLPYPQGMGLKYEEFIQMIVDAAVIEYENRLSDPKPFLKESNLLKSE